MSAELDLGFLTVESVALCTRLHMRGTAKLAPSGKDDIDQLLLQLTRYGLSGDRTELPFITSDETVELLVRLQVQIDLHKAEEHDFFEQLPARLCEMKLWDRLSLSSRSIHISQDLSTTHCISLSLERTSQAASQSKRKLHKLNQGVPLADMRPPEGVSCALLMAVELDIALMEDLETIRSWTSCTKLEGFSGFVTQPQPDGDTHDMLDDSYRVDLPVNEGPGFLDRCNTMSSYYPDGETLHTALEDDCGDVGCITPCLSSALAHKSAAIDSQYDHSSTVSQDILTLVEIAVAAAVDSRRPKREKSVNVMQESFISLASITPSVWKEGHLAATAERAVFLPTISNAITTVCGLSYAPKRLHMKNKQLLARTMTDDGSTDPEAINLSNAVQARLWHLLQQRRYKLPKGRRQGPNNALSPEGPGLTILDNLLDPEHDLEADCSSLDVEDFLLGFEPDQNDVNSVEDEMNDCFEDELLHGEELVIQGPAAVGSEACALQDLSPETTEEPPSACAVLTSPAFNEDMQLLHGTGHGACHDDEDHDFAELDLHSMCSSSMEILSLSDADEIDGISWSQ